MVEHMVVEGEIVARNEIYTGSLDSLPVRDPDLLGDFQELSFRELVTPVGFDGLLDLSLVPNSRETEY
jgi:hypothetical protein